MKNVKHIVAGLCVFGAAVSLAACMTAKDDKQFFVAGVIMVYSTLVLMIYPSNDKA